MTSQFSNSNQAIRSTLEALDEFCQLEELQELVELAFEQFDSGNDGTKRAIILLHTYLKNSREHARNVRKALETVQDTLVHKSRN